MSARIVFILCFTGILYSSLSFSQPNGRNTIDTVKVNKFFRENINRSALEYQYVYKAAVKVFKKGKVLNTAHLETKFTPSHLLVTDSLHSNLIRYRLFAGSNGIIGKDIILFINKDGRVEELEIRDFGR